MAPAEERVSAVHEARVCGGAAPTRQTEPEGHVQGSAAEAAGERERAAGHHLHLHAPVGALIPIAPRPQETPAEGHTSEHGEDGERHRDSDNTDTVSKHPVLLPY